MQLCSFVALIRRKADFFIYLLVGVISAGVDTYSLYALHNIFLLGLDTSVTLSFIFGLLTNYILHSAVTFKAKIKAKIFIKYLTVVFFNYIITLLLMKLLYSNLDFDIIFSKVITLPIISIIGYFLSKVWIYRD